MITYNTPSERLFFSLPYDLILTAHIIHNFYYVEVDFRDNLMV